MKTTAYVTHSDCSRHDTGWAHPEHQGRLPAVARAVYRDMLTLFEPLLEVEAVPAAESDLLLAHGAGYIARVRDLAAEADAAGGVLPLTGDTFVSGASWDGAVAAVGAALTGVRAVLEGEVRNAFCAVRPPGHRAGWERSGGYGIFNPVAVAARHLRERREMTRVLVVEWGSSLGDGIQEIVSGDPGTRFVSVHLESNAAFARGVTTPWSRAVPPNADGAAMLAALDGALDEALRDFAPEFVLLSLGCDALATDPIGGLALEPHDYHALTGAVRARAEAHCSGRVVSVLEEGYDPAAMGLAVVQHLRSLSGLEPA